MTTPTGVLSFSSSLVARANVGSADRARMFTLLDRHFAGVSPEQFERDLESKDWVLLLRGAAGEMVGFSTLAVYETKIDATPVSVVCSGDTIVDPSAWSSAALPREWITAVKQLRSRFPRGPYYWLLLTSGFRTYRLLSTFWKTFWPRFDAPTPPPMQQILDTLAGERFGDRYDPAGGGAGVVRFERPQVLRPHLAGIPPQRLRDPHVAFFARHNPGHVRGDEMVCLCELNDSNLTRAGARMVFGPEGR